MSDASVPETPYTTITVKEYNRLAATILDLRRRVQRVREALEVKDLAAALEQVKIEFDDSPA